MSPWSGGAAATPTNDCTNTAAARLKLDGCAVCATAGTSAAPARRLSLAATAIAANISIIVRSFKFSIKHLHKFILRVKSTVSGDEPLQINLRHSGNVFAKGPCCSTVPSISSLPLSSPCTPRPQAIIFSATRSSAYTLPPALIAPSSTPHFSASRCIFRPSEQRPQG
jgi:hypothetical protein